LLLGKDTSGHVVNFPLEKLTKHAFICGVPGGGKTNTMLHLTSALWKKYGVPFLVFEPAKKEYRSLFNDPGMKDVMLFSPNAGTPFPIAINPFEFPLGLTLSEHISALMQVFSGAFEVSGPVWYYLNYAIEKAYYALGWKDNTINEGALSYPMLGDITEIYKEGVQSSSYDGDLKGNLTSFLQVRLGGLTTRELDEMFNIPQSTLQPEDWLKTPAVIELEALEQGACNFFILLLCTLIRETLKVSPNAETEHGLRHVIFIEEAHNLISPQTEQQSPEIVNPKISATAYIVKMLAEVRALKEGIVIADQLPSSIASEVMKNTGLKIMHRMTAEDDRHMVGATMSATDVQLEHVGTYQPGDALIFYEGLQLPFRGKIEEWEEGKCDQANPMNNAEIASLLMENPKYQVAAGATVNGLIIKLYITHIARIDNSLQHVSDERRELNERLDKIYADAGNNCSDRLSEVEREFGELCDIMNSCKTDCIELRDSIERMRTRFSPFRAKFDGVSEVYVQKLERYYDITESLLDLQRRIQERVF
jgi:DNA helicase HerA-like ATPase